MKPLVSLLSITLFILWILPLGFFIKPNQEKTACGGLRAVCMCRMGFSALQNKPIEGYSNKSVSVDGRVRSVTGVGGASYLTQAVPVIEMRQAQSIDVKELIVYYKDPLHSPVDHVPKANAGFFSC